MENQVFTAACVQMNSGNDMAANIARATAFIRVAAGKGAEFVALPENAFMMAASRMETIQYAAPMDAHEAVNAMQDLAAGLKIWILFGVAVAMEGKLANRSVLLNPQGMIAAFYDKIHLFDASISGGESHKESDTFAAGSKAATAELPWCKLGMTICYDLRFPQLFRELSQGGAKIITAPSAFTHKTGAAHWHSLLRARAIENSCFIIAPAQCGMHPKERRTFGHSLIIDPWGTVLAEASEEREEVILAKIDMERVEEVRRQLPGWGEK